MDKIYLQVNPQSMPKNLAEYFSKYSAKTLIVSLIQENRDLENALGVADSIIYDNQDYLSGIIDLEEVIINVNENLDLIPSSYKIKKNELDFNDFSRKIEELEYDNFIYIFSDHADFKLDNKPVSKNLKFSLWDKIKGIFKNG